MATNQAPAGGFLHRLFGQNQAAEPAKQDPAGAVPQQQQQPNYQSQALGLPAGSPNPNPEGNNPAAAPAPTNASQVAPVQQQQQQSPVDELSSLLNNSNSSQQSALNPSQDFFTPTPEQLQAISSRAAYGSSIPNELMQSFQQDPTATLPKILDHVTSSMMRDVVPMLAKMTQAGTSHMSNQLRTELPQSIGRQQAVEGIVQKNPMMKPFADMIVGRLQQSNPTMSSSEIQAKAGTLLQGFIDQAATNKTQQQQQQQQANNPSSSSAETIDWGSFL